MTKPVIVGTDGSVPATRAVEWAAVEAAFRGLPLHIVHLLQPWAHLAPSAAIGEAAAMVISDGERLLATAGEAARERLVQEMAKAIEPWRDRHPEVDVVEETPSVHPVLALTEASQEADLVVVGTHGHGWFHFPLGSVSHGILHHSHCPVAVTGAR
ncbi:universal stress protein [Actinomadura barringtoniae]|uniref:Universal stress protein n=1 Tax=Actinomadura barringtoniae TaxID=1427535 RepID=A0A939T676_9ACTN|nr:universal stress protein [Actinomadura barringtoniae]MBO2447952.1 universal stress protein [Actinomadura barringtoniae]